MVFIKYLAKDKLLYALWEHAKPARYFYYCPDKMPILDIDTCREDIHYMITLDNKIDLTTYYGRLLYVDITSDELDTFCYNAYNGNGKAESIILELKKKEMLACVLKFYKI